MKTKKLTLLIVGSCLLITWPGSPARAQQNRDSIIRKKATTTTSTSVDNQQKRETQVADTSRIINEPPVPPKSIRVRIRYQKAYGYLTSSKPDNQAPYSCNAFSVDANVLDR